MSPRFGNMGVVDEIETRTPLVNLDNLSSMITTRVAQNPTKVKCMFKVTCRRHNSEFDSTIWIENSN